MKELSKKEKILDYKNRVIIGGVYRIINSKTNKHLLSNSPNIEGIVNRFNFSKSTGSCVHEKLQKDWDTYTAEAFNIDVLEKIEKKGEQSDKEFLDSLKLLEEKWREELGASNEY